MSSARDERSSGVDPIGDGASTYVKTRFLERIAHDLRGPSGVAIGALDEISAALAAGDVERIAPLLRIAQRAQAKVLRVAEKLTRTAMMVQRTPLDRGVVRVRDALQKAVTQAEAVEGRRNVRCTVDAADETITADAGWLDMILVEIVADAIAHAKSTVRVAASRVGPRVVVEITGDVRSPPPAPRPLLEPSDDRRGLGVTMSLATRMMEELGGELEAGPLDGSPGVRLTFVDRPRVA